MRRTEIVDADQCGLRFEQHGQHGAIRIRGLARDYEVPVARHVPRKREAILHFDLHIARLQVAVDRRSNDRKPLNDHRLDIAATCECAARRRYEDEARE